MRQRMQQQQGANDTASASGAGAGRQDSVFFKTLLCPKCALSLRHNVTTPRCLQHTAVFCQANFEVQYESILTDTLRVLVACWKPHSKAQDSNP